MKTIECWLQTIRRNLVLVPKYFLEANYSKKYLTSVVMKYSFISVLALIPVFLSILVIFKQNNIIHKNIIYLAFAYYFISFIEY